MPSRTYVARRPGPFAALVQAAQLGGLRLHPLPPVRVRDRFYDTEDGGLLRRGLALRVRDQEGALTAALRRLADAETTGPLPDDAELGPSSPGRLDLPPGPLAEYVRSIISGERLRLLLALRQYRTPRVVLDDERPIGLLSFDVVVYEVPGAQVVSNEVEIEPMGDVDGGDTARLDAAFREHGLEPADETKFERGMLRMPRSLSESALVLPRERRQLEATVEAGPPLLQRRARVVLLDARGFRADTIAAQTGLSMARVRHWRQRFREVRLGILQTEVAGVPRRSPPRPAVSRPPVSVEGGPRDLFPSGPGSTGPPPPPPEAPPPPDPPAASVEGDGVPVDPTRSRDMAELLEMFTPHETATPLLDDRPPSEDEIDGDGREDAADGDVLPDEPAGGMAETASPEAPSARRPAYPVVLGPFAATVPSASSAGALVVHSDPPRRSGDGGVASSGRTSRQSLPRPVFSGATPLLYVAQAMIAYHVAAFETALDRLAEGRSDADARRLLIATHRVRLAVESFRMVLPDRAAHRLLAALRPLVADLDEALDYSRAAAVAPSDSFARRRVRALDAALAHLGDGRKRAWADRARRLLRRLDEQHTEGSLIGDDFPLPPDDFVGQPGNVPAPSRVRHVAGSMLWERFEAIRAFEDEMTGEVAPDVAYHLAIAVSGLHFALGLAARASTGPVREVAAVLDQAEHQFAAYRHAHRTAVLLAEVGEEGGGPPEPQGVIDTWEALCDVSFRDALAAVVSGV